ncbi:putative uncharacterized protein BRD3OS isoform X2 [Sapajus apella]|uniref:Uncharacterized protein n=1 Tax=Sapajus apella TaxID=9515 RepID=A0A6J3GIN1_SAPAP|nr:putative uncharacterized protein BRD3OS isoform X2 [Sapajus apella]
MVTLPAAPGPASGAPQRVGLAASVSEAHDARGLPGAGCSEQEGGRCGSRGGRLAASPGARALPGAPGPCFTDGDPEAPTGSRPNTAQGPKAGTARRLALRAAPRLRHGSTTRERRDLNRRWGRIPHVGRNSRRPEAGPDGCVQGMPPELLPPSVWGHHVPSSACWIRFFKLSGPGRGGRITPQGVTPRPCHFHTAAPGRAVARHRSDLPAVP